jgi:hypothetical protein
MLGFLIDEDEFEIVPAITRALTMYEVDSTTKSRRAKKQPPNPQNFDLDILFLSGNTSVSERYPYKIDLTFLETENITEYSIYINDNYLGDDLSSIEINTNDTIRIDVIKNDNTKSSKIKSKAHIPYND